MAVFNKGSDPKVDRLRAVPLFAGASDEALAHLASTVDEIEVSAGTTLIEQGRRHNEGYVIVSGSLNVEVDGEQVATVPAGEMVGDLRLFGFSPASATCIAAEDVSILSIPAQSFDQVLDENPSLTKSIATALAGRLHALDARVTHA